MKAHKLFILSFLSCANLLQGEILSVDVFWAHGSCRDSCTKILETQLRQTKEIESVSTSTTSNMASITWKKTEPFTYKALKLPFQRVGVGIDNIRVKVKGTLSPSKDRIVLVSSENKTTFDLVSLNKAKGTPALLSLDPQFRATFLEYAEKRTPVIIEGALYQAHRSPPLYLLVEKVTVAEEKKEKITY